MKTNLLAICLLFSATAACGGETATLIQRADFEGILQSYDCQDARKGRFFSLRVLGYSFPLTTDYEFVGIDAGLPTFRSVEYLNGKSRKGGWYEGRTTISYFEPASDGAAPGAVLAESEEFQWADLTLYFRASTIGQTGKVAYYQVVVRSSYDLSELRISSSDAHRIAAVLACAEAQ